MSAMVSSGSGKLRPRLGVLVFLFVGALASVWVLRGQNREGTSGTMRGSPGETVQLSGHAHKAGVLSICNNNQISLNVGKGVVKYDLSSGTGEIEHMCPFGSLNLDGTVVFECMSSGMWTLSRHNCYQCEGIDLTLTLKPGQVREVSLDLGSFGMKHTEPCKFKDGKNYDKGEIVFTCGASREWELDESSCSDRNCPSGSTVSMQLEDGKSKDLLLEVDGDHATASCPQGGSMTFDCVEMHGAQSSSGDKKYQWRFVESTCEDVALVNHPDWCPSRTAKINMKYNWGGDSQHAEIALHPAREGVHEFVCPSDWPKPEGKLLFECKGGLWALKHMTCTEDEVVA